MLFPSIQFVQVFLSCPGFAEGNGSSERPANCARLSFRKTLSNFRTKPLGMEAPSPRVVGSPEQQCGTGRSLRGVSAFSVLFLWAGFASQYYPAAVFTEPGHRCLSWESYKHHQKDKRQNIFPVITDNRQAKGSPSCSSLLPL